MKRLQALRVVYVVGAVSTTFAAPTLQPPPEALSGLEEPSTAPLYQFQADGFSATAGLDVREPQVTTILSDETVRTGSYDLFDKTWSVRDDADAHDHDTAVTLADISYNPDDLKPESAAGLDVREPQATTIVVDSVRTSGELIHDTRLLSFIQHDQRAITDALYNYVDSKLYRRAGEGSHEYGTPAPVNEDKSVPLPKKDRKRVVDDDGEVPPRRKPNKSWKFKIPDDGDDGVRDPTYVQGSSGSDSGGDSGGDPGGLAGTSRRTRSSKEKKTATDDSDSEDIRGPPSRTNRLAAAASRRGGRTSSKKESSTALDSDSEPVPDDTKDSDYSPRSESPDSSSSS
ncbi:hypothetical protein FB446DRAFT_848990 [Lentinula raphanica]|nr:hypothetical protein FB446DRAFT_848990 [Lentinula raphanica]